MSAEQQIPSPDGAGVEHMERSLPGDVTLGRSLALVRYLRDHCEWDARQTPGSLRPYLLEEAHEVADAVLSGQDDELRRELGDLLLNVAFQIVLAEERGAFDASGVVAGMEGKMRDRHPHVYGDAEEAPDWERMKADQRDRDRVDSESEDRLSDPFDGLPAGLLTFGAASSQDLMHAAPGDSGGRGFVVVTAVGVVRVGMERWVVAVAGW